MEKQVVMGFENCEISIFDNPTGDAPATNDGSKVIKVNNIGTNGAAQELKIDGLSGETKKKYGNNGVAFTSSRPIGDLKLTLTTLGMPLEEKMALIGAKNQDNKIFNVSADNVVPSCALWFESPTKDGKTAIIGVYSTKASLGDINWETLDNGAEDPKGDEMTFVAETDGRESTAKSYYVQAILDKDGADATNYKKLRDYVLRLETPGVSELSRSKAK